MLKCLRKRIHQLGDGRCDSAIHPAAVAISANFVLEERERELRADS